MTHAARIHPTNYICNDLYIKKTYSLATLILYFFPLDNINIIPQRKTDFKNLDTIKIIEQGFKIKIKRYDIPFE